MFKNIKVDVKLNSGIELAVPMTLLLGKYAGYVCLLYPSTKFFTLTPADLGLFIPNIGVCCDSHFVFPAAKAILVQGLLTAQKYCTQSEVFEMALTTNMCIIYSSLLLILIEIHLASHIPGQTCDY